VEGLSVTWRALAAGLEAAIALCAAINLAYFLHRARSVESLSRRAAAFVLALMALGTLAESMVALASLQSADDVGVVVSSGAWIVARSITLAATGCICALVIRAMGNGK
jgi:cellobiose-specific phosphotransferase system component IIC